MMKFRIRSNFKTILCILIIIIVFRYFTHPERLNLNKIQQKIFLNNLYTTRNWVFNFDDSQYSSIVSVEKDSLSFESLVFIDNNANVNSLKCAVLIGNSMVRIIQANSILTIELMRIVFWPKDLYRITCKLALIEYKGIDPSKTRLAIIQDNSIIKSMGTHTY